MAKTPTNAEKVDSKAEFIFTGDPNDNYSGPGMINMKGVLFHRGVPVKVPDHLRDFFTRHNHFSTPAQAEKLRAKFQKSAAVTMAPEEDDFEMPTGEEIDAMNEASLIALAATLEIDMPVGLNQPEMAEFIKSATAE